MTRYQSVTKSQLLAVSFDLTGVAMAVMRLAGVALLVGFVAPLFGQWLPSGATTGNIYYQNGNVGIGTASPDNLLEAYGTDNPAIHVSLGAGSGWTAQDGWISRFTNRLQINASDAISLGVGNQMNSTLWINSAGNVGIGTPSPGTPLHILGAGTTNNFYSNGDATGGALYLQDSGGLPMNGGEILFGAQQGMFASIKGLIQNGTGPAGALMFGSRAVSGNIVERMRVDANGNVGIGTTNPAHLLHVAGTIGAEGVIVSSTGADYVFDPGYRLAPLAEVSAFIQRNHHLPDIPSAAEGNVKGVSLGEMQSKQLAKIEELTLHMIRAEESNDELKRENQELRVRLEQLERNATAPTAKKEARP